MSTKRDIRESMTAFRKRRGLLSRAYRKARARKDYVKALELSDAGARQGINVGGIQRYDQIRDLVTAQVAQANANADALQKELTTPAPQLMTTPKVDEEPTAPAAGVAFLDEEIGEQNPYTPSYFSNRALFS